MCELCAEDSAPTTPSPPQNTYVLETRDELKTIVALMSTLLQRFNGSASNPAVTTTASIMIVHLAEVTIIYAESVVVEHRSRSWKDHD